jgi:putative SbcD/Mre11-related phosphoesterase
MKLEPIPNEPALLLKDKKKTLILADLHIGIEAELKEAGINIPSQTEKIAEHLIALCEENEIDELIILGDIKHNVPLTSRQEYFELPSIFQRFKEKVDKIHVVPGNHDGSIRNLLPEWVEIHSSKGFAHKKIGFFHGHTWPSKEVMKCNQVIIAHEHPTIQFIETLGERDSRACWVKTKFIPEVTKKTYPDSEPELIILPAFNEILGGTPVNEKKAKFLSPVLTNKLVDMDDAAIYLLNGTFLGKLKDLRV